jgi:DNA-binding response OmpR family regulator
MASRVLVVDDDAATRVGLAELLTGAGYETCGAATFEEAQRVLRTDPPDLLIADVRLGAFNGLQLLVASPRRIPAIIITGFADPVLESDARQHGAEYILKPISPAALLEAVRRRLTQAADSAFDTPRRWERKTVRAPLTLRVDDLPARVLDISYGGLRFEIPRVQSGELPRSLSLRLPDSDVAVRANLVWQTLRGEDAVVCGAAVSQTSAATAREWRGLVDAVS